MAKEIVIDTSGTEGRILEAAKKIFIMHGLEGTSMQQIADEAKINKSLLHYYFRTKERLFESVFAYAFQFFLPAVKEILDSEEDLFSKIERIVDKYMNMLISNKFIPAFILNEINRNPDRLYDIFISTGMIPQLILDQFQSAIEKGTIRRIDPRHLIINILALCIFPIAARPLLQRLFFDNCDIDYQQFLQERKRLVTDFIIQSIKI